MIIDLKLRHANFGLNFFEREKTPYTYCRPLGLAE